jgi:hypothetical protein
MIEWHPSKEAAEEARQYLERYGWTIPATAGYIRLLQKAMTIAYTWDKREQNG